MYIHVYETNFLKKLICFTETVLKKKNTCCFKHIFLEMEIAMVIKKRLSFILGSESLNFE